MSRRDRCAIADHAARVVAALPPLTDAQAERIAAIMRNAPPSRAEIVKRRLAELDAGDGGAA